MKRAAFFAAAVACLLAVFASSVAAAAEAGFGARAREMAEITGVRIGDSAGRTRIVVDATKAVSFKKIVLSNPDRVVVDIESAWISPKAKLAKAVDSRFVGSVRVAQFDKSTVRVVVETKVGKQQYKVFALSGGPVPGRIVLDFGNLGASAPGAAIALPDGGSPETQPAASAAPATKPAQQPAQPAPQTPAPAVPDGSDPDAAAEDPEIAAITGLKGRRITIDAGHGGSDPGAIGPTGVMEKSVTLRIASELRRLLLAEGATVYMTRTGDTEVSPKGAHATDVEELQARCDVANENTSDIFLSIHTDSFSSSDAHGTTGYYYTKGSEASKRLADKVRTGVIDEIGTASRGTQGSNFYVVKHTLMPATLIEVAFISNPDEEKLLDSEDGIMRAAQGIADGIADYFG